MMNLSERIKPLDKTFLTWRFIVVDVDALELEFVVAHVLPGGGDVVLDADHLPELMNTVNRGYKLARCNRW